MGYCSQALKDVGLRVVQFDTRYKLIADQQRTRIRTLLSFLRVRAHTLFLSLSASLCLVIFSQTLSPSYSFTVLYPRLLPQPDLLQENPAENATSQRDRCWFIATFATSSLTTAIVKGMLSQPLDINHRPLKQSMTNFSSRILLSYRCFELIDVFFFSSDLYFLFFDLYFSFLRFVFFILSLVSFFLLLLFLLLFYFFFFKRMFLQLYSHV